MVHLHGEGRQDYIQYRRTSTWREFRWKDAPGGSSATRKNCGHATVAPVFARKNIAAFAADMMAAAQALVERCRDEQPSIVDVSAEMARLTLEVLQKTIFSDGLERDAEQFRVAMRTYFDTIGRIDPLDVLGVPAFVPRFTRWRTRSTLRFFDAAIDDIVRIRRRQLSASMSIAPNDILTLLLRALNSDTCNRMSDVEVRSNILTFIAAGHETTANLLTWALFLLSQSPEWCERVEAECERELAAGAVEGVAARLIETRAVLSVQKKSFSFR